MGLFEDLERVKLRFISVCEDMVGRGQLSESEFQQVLELLDKMDDYDDRQFLEELGEISKGMTDFIDWKAMAKARR
ncbi:MAG TPA: hypothetical protein GX008_10160 [Firmicutes bacterium]|nr:MAG: hypothetical protein AA931_08270 [Peptococcaceae bacterium 1109]HHT74062.1 hypothetical protein [Bacillota bacterium]